MSRGRWWWEGWRNNLGTIRKPVLGSTELALVVELEGPHPWAAVVPAGGEGRTVGVHDVAAWIEHRERLPRWDVPGAVPEPPPEAEPWTQLSLEVAP